MTRKGTNQVMAITMAVPIWVEIVENSYQNDDHCKEIMEQLSIAPNPDSHYTYHSGVIRYKTEPH